MRYNSREAAREPRMQAEPEGRTVVLPHWWLEKGCSAPVAACLSFLLGRNKQISLPERPLCSLRRASARCAGVVRRPVMLIACCAGVVRALVVLIARYGQPDRVQGVVPDQSPLCRYDTRGAWFRPNARCASVVPCRCGRPMRWQPRTASRVAEHAVAADRFARKIVGF